MDRAKIEIIKRRSGFTLTELMVVVIIFAILATVAIPGFSKWLPNTRLKRASRDLFSNLQLAKLAAIKQNADCSVTYSSNPDQYTISCLNKTVILGDYGSGVQFEGPGGETFSAGTITFNSRGLSNAGYAYLSNDRNSAYYRVGPLTSGAIRIQKWNGSSWE